jgi:uncharacterized protein (TIGR02147 family)
MSRDPVSVFSQSSYRTFLKKVLAEGKNHQPPLTLTRFAKKLEMSPSALQMVMDGQRNLTIHKAHVIADALGFTTQEEERFLAMVHFEQAETRKERDFYGRKIKETAEQKTLPVRRVSAQELLSEWYTPTLLVYFLDAVGEPDFSRIESSLGIKEPAARAIYERLLELDLLKKDATDEKVHIVYDKIAAAFPKEQYSLKLLKEIERRIRKDFRAGHSYFESHTLSICPERYLDFVADYKKLLEKYITLGPKTGTPVVYQSLMSFIRTL